MGKLKLLFLMFTLLMLNDGTNNLKGGLTQKPELDVSRKLLGLVNGISKMDKEKDVALSPEKSIKEFLRSIHHSKCPLDNKT